MAALCERVGRVNGLKLKTPADLQVTLPQREQRNDLRCEV